VSQDWRTPLCGEKTEAYAEFVKKLEVAYTIFSVSLDEALGMRRAGRAMKAQEALGVSGPLCYRLSIPLRCLLKSMVVHARHFGITPNLVPLNPANFQSVRSQRVARFNELFSKVLLTRKSQFIHKISTVEDLVEELESRFNRTAEELTEDESIQPVRDWELLDAVHYDLNTCLRETVVLYKSFLHALPAGQLPAFEVTLRENCESGCPAKQTGTRHLAHRRMAFLKGQ
jgi:hypothetical protein